MTCTFTARFTAKQTNLLYVGFRPLILNHLSLTNTGRSPGAHPDILTTKFVHRRGEFDREYMGGILELWKNLQVNRGKKLRISLDYVGISACMLAVRTALRQIRHGHMPPWDRRIQATATHLLSRLEALRKRLKRTIIKAEGYNSFRSLASSWSQFLTWLRLTLLTCPCLIRRPNSFYRGRQRLIDQMVHVTVKELQAQKAEIPPARVLRKLVRDALKNVRRFRTPWTTPLLRRNPSIAAWWFGEYVVRSHAR